MLMKTKTRNPPIHLDPVIYKKINYLALVVSDVIEIKGESP